MNGEGGKKKAAQFVRFQHLSANGLNAFISMALCVKGKLHTKQISGASGKYSNRLFIP